MHIVFHIAVRENLCQVGLERTRLTKKYLALLRNVSKHDRIVQHTAVRQLEDVET